ncbi:MAG: tRNA preQ1(34) S-adenosylmethionine ribosyltransferase-isomerase QueA [Planctomycetota bacterium]
MLPTRDLDYDLPPELVATRPAEPRDAARLMVLRGDAPPEHRVFRDLPDLLERGDRVVLNTSRVLPARFVGVREDTGGRVEGLFLGVAGQAWHAMIKSRRFRAGAVVRLSERDGSASADCIELAERLEGTPGAWVVRPRLASGSGDARADAIAVLDRLGRPPLPPYIRSARRRSGEPDDGPADLDRYQTIYAGESDAASAPAAGSVAAPTAGLHFTAGVFGGLEARGIARRDVRLHVGIGTFRDVEADTVEAHDMHAEWCHAEAAAMRDLVGAADAGGRVVAVGSTATRTLETLAESPGDWGRWIETSLLVTPGWRWRLVGGMVTNFHLPRSTLMALVAAMLPGGVQQLHAVYRIAIERRYRFYSYGDAMLILP